MVSMVQENFNRSVSYLNNYIFKDVVKKVMKGDSEDIADSDLPHTKSKIIFFVSSTFTDTKAERNHLMKGTALNE